MSIPYEECERLIRSKPERWLVTGAAGFIGSHLVETLLALGQEVIGLDNFATGSQENLDQVITNVGPARAKRFRFAKGDICDSRSLAQVSEGVSYVLHQAALGSVPRSIKDPFTVNRVNVEGTLMVFLAAQTAKVKRVVFASSSSVYGDSPANPKREGDEGALLSPYALTKHTCEQYAAQFAAHYGQELVGLRYFNVFGPRQNPEGEYAAVIPRWINARARRRRCTIFGNGLTSRDFCYVENVVRANIQAALAPPEVIGKCFNIAVGEETTLSCLYDMIDSLAAPNWREPPEYADFRAGDVRQSRADIGLAANLLGYQPKVRLAEGVHFQK